MTDAPERIIVRVDYDGTHDGTWIAVTPYEPPVEYTGSEPQYIRADLVPQWRPIETAPRGGAVVLIAHNYWRGSGIAQYRYPEGWCYYADGTKISHQHEIIHWMPIPEPPK